MFKAFLTFLFFFIGSGSVCAQTSFKDSEGEQENTLAKYINASAVCAKMTDPEALYERGMLLLSDANNDAYMAAADCFTSAAMRNHTPSQLELGKLYEKGNGVSQSKIFAYKWYQTAVLLGNQEAAPFRNKLEAGMTFDEISLANPMIQSTLNLIELFNQRQQMAIEEMEEQIAQQYRDFGVDISQYETKEEEESNVYDNPLIEALIRDQRAKEEKGPGQRGAEQKDENDDSRRSRRRRRRAADTPQTAGQTEIREAITETAR